MGMGSLTGSTWAKVRELADARQTGFQHLFAEVIQLELNVRAPGTVTAATFADLDHDGTGHHVATGQIAGVRRITLHEALAVFIEQVAAFTAATFGHQHPAPAMPVGWNCQNSMSCTPTPARSAMPTPSPVLMWALVVDW